MMEKRKLNISKSFYHCKIARSGGSRYIAIGRILPPDWHFVKLTVLKLEDKSCLLQLQKLD